MNIKESCQTSNENTTSGKLPPPKVETITFGPWKITAIKSHILNSKCMSPDKCHSDNDEQKLTANTREGLCSFCWFEKQVNRSHLPDMIFNDNVLRVEHESGKGIEFTALGALQQLRDFDHDHIQVAHAKEWREAREDCEHTRNVVTGYDWTYTTDYCGTLLGGLQSQSSQERIDIEKLKSLEPIRFFQELYLYEDELDDNGATNCVVKIRCMDSGFLVLFRHYLRVDHVLVRVRETRLYHSTGSNYIIRERCCKSKTADKLQVDSSVLRCPDQVSSLLNLEEETIDRLTFSEES